MVAYVGFDVSKEETAFCVKEETGKVVARGKAATAPDTLFEVLREHCLRPERIVLETGTLSAWLARERRGRGLPVDVIDARQAHAVTRLQHNKTDANDAELLAEIARTGFHRAVSVKSADAQGDRITLKARHRLIGLGRDLENAIRGLLGTVGLRFPKGTGKFARRVRAILAEPPELTGVISPLLAAREALKEEARRMDGDVMARAKGSAARRLLMTAPGVGPIAAPAFSATIDDPARFAKSRAEIGSPHSNIQITCGCDRRTPSRSERYASKTASGSRCRET